MHVIAVVVAGGSGVSSDGAALDVLTPIAGVPMAVRSVRAVLASGIADRVLVRAGARTAAVLRACAGLPVGAYDVTGAHALQRADTAQGDGAGRSVVVVHDANRPLVPPELFTAVLAAVRDGHDVVVPVLPLTDTVKIVDGAGLVRGTPDRAGLRVRQTPCAVRPGRPDPGLAGAHTVPGDPMAFAVRTAWDLQLAELLVEGNGL